jgi:hypothetical protein
MEIGEQRGTESYTHQREDIHKMMTGFFPKIFSWQLHFWPHRCCLVMANGLRCGLSDGF